MNKKHSIKYSILIPAYKSRFLSEALRSVKEQTYEEFQCIVVDDCSPENLKQIYNEVVENDNRFEYYRNSSNYGAINVVDNWNVCLSYARGNYVICMGDDDRLLPCCLSEFNKLIDRYPNLDVYHARTEIINENGDMIDLQEARPEWESAYSALWHQCRCKRIQFLGDFLFRSSTLKMMGGFYKLRLAVFSDNISSIRAAKESGIANTSVICFQYRESRHTISRNSHPRILVDSTKKAYDWFMEFLLETPRDEIDKKYRNQLLRLELWKYMCTFMCSLIDRDLEDEGLSAIKYWENNYNALGIEEWRIKLKIKLFRREFVKKKIKFILHMK